MHTIIKRPHLQSYMTFYYVYVHKTDEVSMKKPLHHGHGKLKAK